MSALTEEWELVKVNDISGVSRKKSGLTLGLIRKAEIDTGNTKVYLLDKSHFPPASGHNQFGSSDGRNFPPGGQVAWWIDSSEYEVIPGGLPGYKTPVAVGDEVMILTPQNEWKRGTVTTDNEQDIGFFFNRDSDGGSDACANGLAWVLNRKEETVETSPEHKVVFKHNPDVPVAWFATKGLADLFIGQNGNTAHYEDEETRTAREKSEKVAKIEAALADLGDNSDKIAYNLLAKGVKGNRGDSNTCPVANYLTDLLGEHARVGGDVKVGNVVIPTPENISAFIGVFDRHNYPALEK